MQPFHPILYQSSDYLSMLEFKFYHASKRGPSWQKYYQKKEQHLDYTYGLKHNVLLRYSWWYFDNSLCCPQGRAKGWFVGIRNNWWEIWVRGTVKKESGLRIRGRSVPSFSIRHKFASDGVPWLLNKMKNSINKKKTKNTTSKCADF